MDVCCFNRPFDDQTQNRIRIESEAALTILSRCQEDWKLVRSEIIDYEISKIPDDERRKKVEILASISKEKLMVDEDIVNRAMELENIGFKPVDALHLACAEKSADVILTTDDDIVKKAKNPSVKVDVENPLRWLTEVLEGE